MTLRYGLDSTASTSDVAVTRPTEASAPGKKQQQRKQGQQGKGNHERDGRAAVSPAEVAVRIPEEAATTHAQVTVADAEALSALAIRTFKAAFAHVNTPENVDMYVSESLSVEAHASQLADPLNTYFWARARSRSRSRDGDGGGDDDEDEDEDEGEREGEGRGPLVGFCKLRRPEGLLQGPCPEPCVTGEKTIELGNDHCPTFL